MDTDFPQRWNRAWIEARQRAEQDATRLPRPRRRYALLGLTLRACGLYRKGYRNYLALETHHVTHRIPQWPARIDGFSVLHLSDLHLDLDPALLPVLLRAIQNLTFDLAIITGDFLERCHAPSADALAALDPVLQAVLRAPCGAFGVLGNHDSLHLAAALEPRGLRFLNNEAVVLPTDTPIALAGVDDAYVFDTHDLPAAAAQCPQGLPRLLLSHSPQCFGQAHHLGFLALFSGHTHGGQICLPGGHPILRMPRIPPKVFKGPWTHLSLNGYTSCGIGACHLPVRFHCPPEIVLHRFLGA